MEVRRRRRRWLRTRTTQEPPGVCLIHMANCVIAAATATVLIPSWCGG